MFNEKHTCPACSRWGWVQTTPVVAAAIEKPLASSCSKNKRETWKSKYIQISQSHKACMYQALFQLLATFLCTLMLLQYFCQATTGMKTHAFAVRCWSCNVMEKATRTSGTELTLRAEQPQARSVDGSGFLQSWLIYHDLATQDLCTTGKFLLKADFEFQGLLTVWMWSRKAVRAHNR